MTLVVLEEVRQHMGKDTRVLLRLAREELLLMEETEVLAHTMGMQQMVLQKAEEEVVLTVTLLLVLLFLAQVATDTFV